VKRRNAIKLYLRGHGRFEANRSDGSWSDDDYDAVPVDTGKAVGGIFRRSAEISKEAAKQAFAGAANVGTLAAVNALVAMGIELIYPIGAIALAVGLLWGVFHYRNRRRGETMVGDQKTRELFRSDDTQ